MAHRIRQHVNPLGIRFAQPRALPIEPSSRLGPVPVDVELGCADAQFSVQLATRHPGRFVVGLDIREKILDVGRARAAALGLDNLVFGYVNLNVDLERVFADAAVDRFHLLFPDPWFKAKHRKRRVLEPRTLAVIRRQLRPGGELHVATDVFDIALEAMAQLEDSAMVELGFRNLAGSWRFWRGNPFGVTSRREDTTLQRGQRVWRVRYRVPGDVCNDSTGGIGNASGSAAQRA